MNKSAECVFCEIIAGRIDATILSQNDDTIIIEPLEKVVPRHSLIIPKIHAETIVDITAESLSAVMLALQSHSTILMKDENIDGINILQANGPAAQQSVSHLHFHVVPRRVNDGLDLWIKNNL